MDYLINFLLLLLKKSPATLQMYLEQTYHGDREIIKSLNRSFLREQNREYDEKEMDAPHLFSLMEEGMRQMQVAWRAHSHSTFNEDVRVELQFEWFVRRNDLSLLEALLKQLPRFIDLVNERLGPGYEACSLTSLWVSAEAAREQLVSNKVTTIINSYIPESVPTSIFLEGKPFSPFDVTLAVGDMLRVDSPEALAINQQRLNNDIGLANPHFLARVGLLNLLHSEVQLYQHFVETALFEDLARYEKKAAVNIFPEEKLAFKGKKILAALTDKDHPIQQVYKNFPDSKKKLSLFEFALLLRACLFDQGKNAEQRLAFFKQLFMQHRTKLLLTGDAHIDNATRKLLLALEKMMNENNHIFLLNMPKQAIRRGFFQRLYYGEPLWIKVPVSESAGVPATGFKR